MRTFVIDASTSIKSVLKDEDNYKIAQKIVSDFLDAKISLLSPNLWIYEVAQALRSATLSKRISHPKSKRLFTLLFKARPTILPVDQIMSECLENSNRYQISIYDSAYITLAKASKVPLISSDSKLVRKINNPSVIIGLNEYKL